MPPNNAEANAVGRVRMVESVQVFVCLRAAWLSFEALGFL
jgi:hypothetical protein